jgi:hypothetical protein
MSQSKPQPPTDPRLRAIYESARQLELLRLALEHARRTAEMLRQARAKRLS